MEQIMCGMLVRSKAGHDAKTLYLVCRTEGDFVYLCDGRLRKFDSPKKKNKKHIQIISQNSGSTGKLEWRSIER